MMDDKVCKSEFEQPDFEIIDKDRVLKWFIKGGFPQPNENAQNIKNHIARRFLGKKGIPFCVFDKIGHIKKQSSF